MDVRSAGSARIASTISTWFGLRSAASADAELRTGWMTRPSPVCAQMIVVFGWRRSSAFIWGR